MPFPPALALSPDSASSKKSRMVSFTIEVPKGILDFLADLFKFAGVDETPKQFIHATRPHRVPTERVGRPEPKEHLKVCRNEFVTDSVRRRLEELKALAK